MTVEQWARPTDPPARHPAATFGKRAQLAGWRVEYRTARGPVTTRKRPDEPDERGKYALVSVTTLADSIGVRAQHPDGRRIAAWWVGTTFGEGWAASPRTNAHQLGIRALTAYLTEDEGDEMNESKNDDPDGCPDTVLGGCEAVCARCGRDMAHAAEQAGDAYGEGYAAGLAAVAGRAQVWVKTRRRLDALRPGDEVVGHGEKKWTVEEWGPLGGTRWRVTAWHLGQCKEIVADRARKVDVVEQIAVADALDALKGEGVEPVPIAPAADSVESEVA